MVCRDKREPSTYVSNVNVVDVRASVFAHYE